MKPRVFIGSAKDSLVIAEAIDANLCRHAECTCWDNVFRPSDSTMSGLLEELEKSDFGVFVFEPSDVAVFKGTKVDVVRDNVIFEMGLYAGKLGIGRSFFVLPEDSTKLHLPTDLAGITSLHYNPSRSDKNWRAATRPACSEIATQIRQLGFSPHRTPDKIRELAIDYVGCNRIDDVEKRVTEKTQIFNQMRFAVHGAPINKDALLKEERLGSYVAFAAAVMENPEAEDCDRVLLIPAHDIPPGNAQHKLMDAIKVLCEQKANSSQSARIAKWLEMLPNKDSSLKNRLEAFKKGLR